MQMSDVYLPLAFMYEKMVLFSQWIRACQSIPDSFMSEQTVTALA
jgi:hypothetical protein